MNKMKCELCHKAEAETAIQKKIDGINQELYVCGSCAREALRSDEPPVAVGQAHVPVDSSEGLSALPLMGMILDAAFEIVGRTVPFSEQTCPVCGITRSEYRKASRLGCPACYEAFAKELDVAVEEMHRSLQHVGKTPEKAKALWQRRKIEQSLDSAVKGQRYEEAIALRDQLRQLDKPSERREGDPA